MPSPRTLTLYALLLCMELLGGFVIAVGFSLFELTNMGYSLFWLAVLVGCTGLAASLVAGDARVPRRFERSLVVGAGILVVAAITWRGAPDLVSGLGTAVLLGLAYWRGVALTLDPPGVEEVQRRFGQGFMFFFIGVVGLIGRGIFSDRSTWQLVAFAGLGYIVIALIALSISRMERRREPGALSAITLAVATQLAIVAILGVVALQFFSLDLFGWLGTHTQGVADTVGATLFNLVTPFAEAIARLLSVLAPHGNPAAHRISVPSSGDNSQTKNLHKGPRQRGDYTAYAAVGLTISALFFLTLILAVWHARRRPDGGDVADERYTERRESLLSFRLLVELLKRWLRRRSEAVVETVQATRQRFMGASLPGNPIRRTYAEMLRRGAAAGSPRSPAATPEEFARQLHERWPTVLDDVRSLTTAYMKERYSDARAAPGEVEAAVAASRRIQSAMQANRRDG
jgi:hypothetical protein